LQLSHVFRHRLIVIGQNRRYVADFQSFVLRHVSRSSYPEGDRVMILLSIKAGLKACEIAGLDWSMALDPQGKVSGTINVRDVIAKKRGGRRIPMHSELRCALERLARTVEPVGPIIRSYRGGHLKANSVVN
jgi:integrase